jgi:hypothetical protein
MNRFLSKSLPVITLLVCQLPTLSTAAVLGDDGTQVHKTVKANGEKSLVVNLSLGAVVLKVSPSDAGVLYSYDYKSSDSSRIADDYSLEDGVGKVDISTDKKQRGGRRGFRLLGFNLWGKGDSENESFRTFDVSFSNAIPIDFRCSVGASTGEMNFTGLKVSSLSLSAGASRASIRFDKPNPVPMKLLEVSAGASRFIAHGLGNANFDKMEFNGGASSCELNFDGDLRRQVSVDVSVGAGTVRINIPKSVAVRLEMSDNFFSNCSMPDGFTKRGELYYSPNYSKAQGLIILSVSNSAGNTTIHWMDGSEDEHEIPSRLPPIPPPPPVPPMPQTTGFPK